MTSNFYYTACRVFFGGILACIALRFIFGETTWFHGTPFMIITIGLGALCVISWAGGVAKEQDEKAAADRQQTRPVVAPLPASKAVVLPPKPENVTEDECMVERWTRMAIWEIKFRDEPAVPGILSDKDIAILIEKTNRTWTEIEEEGARYGVKVWVPNQTLPNDRLYKLDDDACRIYDREQVEYYLSETVRFFAHERARIVEAQWLNSEDYKRESSKRIELLLEKIETGKSKIPNEVLEGLAHRLIEICAKENTVVTIVRHAYTGHLAEQMAARIEAA